MHTEPQRKQSPEIRLQAWRRIGVAALAVTGLLTLSFIVVTGDIIPPVIVFSVVLFTLAGLAAAFGGQRRWPWVLGAIGAFAYVALNLPFLVMEISHPEEAYTFVPLVLLVIGAILALIAAVSVILRRSPDVRPILGVAAAVGVIAVVVSVGALLRVEDEAQQSGDVVLVAEKVRFPERFEVASGTQWFYFDNRDRIRHTFTIDEIGVHVDMPATVGRRAQVNLAPGEYRFYCDVAGHESMTGILVVRPATAAQ
jgi:plastocyanin